jgi:hypothetical protein
MQAQSAGRRDERLDDSRLPNAAVGRRAPLAIDRQEMSEGGNY